MKGKIKTLHNVRAKLKLKNDRMKVRLDYRSVVENYKEGDARVVEYQLI